MQNGILRKITFFVSVLVAGTHISMAQSFLQAAGGTVGRSFHLSDPPKTVEWLYVFETLMGVEGEDAMVSADATICMRADGEVANALLQLYVDPRFQEFRTQIARPFAGFQGKAAQEVSLEAVRNPDLSPAEPIVVEASKNALRNMGMEGLMAVVRKINNWGELPREEDLDRWLGVDLAELLSHSVNPAHQALLLELLEGREERFGSGGRLAVACALIGIRDEVDKDRVSLLLKDEDNPIVKKCLEAVVADGEEGERVEGEES